MTHSNIPIATYPMRRLRPASRLARLGDWMNVHRRLILALQWFIVLFYALLVVLPAFLPLPNPEARLLAADFGASSYVDPAGAPDAAGQMAPTLDKAPYVAQWYERLVLLAQYLFWGVWWPFVILSVMFMGRFWCGVLCPEGALTEFAARHSRGRAIPRWLRWGGWPFLAFVLTTVYGQLISVYEYATATLLILGGSTVAAALVGWLYGRGKRVWCRYLCPVSGVFALLARLSPFYYRINREAWERYPQRTHAVDCPPLLDVKHLNSAAQCHACGHCSGHRGAADLALRSPNTEVLAAKTPHTSEALLLVFGMLGVAIGAFQWTLSPWYVALRQAAATWLIEHDQLWALEANAPWWLLTHYPQANDAFTWLDGALILVYIGATALLLGGAVLLGLTLAARIARIDWRALALSLIPIAGLGLFLGLSMMSANHLRAEGVPLGWLPAARAVILAAGILWSAWLAARLIFGRAPNRTRALMALPLMALPLSAIAGTWIEMFYVW